MFINRDWTRTENDDFKLNIEPRLDDLKEVVEVKIDGEIIGWKIQTRFE